MMTDKINNGLISLIKDRTPEGTTIANYLMDILYIGKEAVYRRLRGEVPFTLTEAAVISRNLGISLDQMVGYNPGQSAIFTLNIAHYTDPMQTYMKVMQIYLDIFNTIRDEPNSQMGTASNTIPQTFYMKYDALSKFRLFKWMYQNDRDSLVGCYNELTLAPELREKQKEFVSLGQFLKHTCYIWDSMVFQHIVNDIKYFTKIHMMTEDNLRELRDELLMMLDELEEIAARGQFSSGRKAQIYISNINFEATYSYVATDYHQSSMIGVYSINSITTDDMEMYLSLKNWIHSLKKFSTLISQSGEMQRIQFFKEQRDIVNSLCTEKEKPEPAPHTF